MAPRAVVVGAGLAGLTAAEQLVHGGWDVTVLEASSRVGGRTMTVFDRFVDGQHAEAGAEWVDSVHRRVHALVVRFGLSLDPNVTRWSAIRRWLFRNGVLLGPDDLHRNDPTLAADLDRFEAAFTEIAAGIADPAHPEHHPDAERYDRLSVADLIADLELGSLARLFATRNMQGEFAAEPHEVSQLFVAQQRAVYEHAEAKHGFVEARRVIGGVGALADHLAAALPQGCVRLDQRVQSVTTTSAGVTVTTPTTRHEADAVILASSLIALRSVTFSPPLPADLAAAIHGLGYGTVTKTALQYPQRTWSPGYATTDGRAQRVYEPTVADTGQSGILMAYTGGDGGRALGHVDERERMHIIETSEREMYPTLPASIGGFSQAWSAEALFGGSYAVYRPGEIARFWAAVRRPYGRLHLAGEHTATWTGYLEGALESGETAAARVLQSG